MLILTREGDVYYVANDDYDEVKVSINEYTLQPALVSLNAVKVSQAKILHNINSEEVILEPGYTFYSFIKMLNKYPPLLNLKIFSYSHLARFNAHDFNKSSEPNINAVMGVVKVTRKWAPFDEIYPNVQLRCFDNMSGELSVHKKYEALVRDNRLTYEWLEENGFGFIGVAHWETIVANEIILINSFSMDKQNDTPNILFIDFMYALFDNVCCDYANRTNKYIKDRLGISEDDEYVDTDTEGRDLMPTEKQNGEHDPSEKGAYFEMDEDTFIMLSDIAERNRLTVLQLVKLFINLGIIIEKNEYGGGSTIIEDTNGEEIVVLIRNKELENTVQDLLNGIIKRTPKTGS